MAASLLAGCASAAPRSQLVPPDTVRPAHARRDAPTMSIGVVDDGWHTGLILPATELGFSLAGLRHRFAHAKYLVFGWGNRRFYEAAGPGVGMAVTSLFPSASVVFVQGVARRAQLAPPGATVHWLCISRAGLRGLDAFLDGYFRKEPRGRPADARAGSAPHGEFFASTGTYDAFHTCNTWTAETLHSAGLPVRATGVIFASQVMSEIRPLRACAKRIRVSGPGTAPDPVPRRP
ncbi:MAG: DUF2459 domain-containing protein [Acidiferrobacterales bacterium]